MAATKTEGSEHLSAEAFAYVPDSSSPSTWKLRIDDPVHVGAAVAAFGPSGYRGQKVQIPAGDLSAVKAKVLAAWKKFHPDSKPEDIPVVLKKGGSGGMTPQEMQDKMDEVMSMMAEMPPEMQTKMKAKMMSMMAQVKKGDSMTVEERIAQLEKDYAEVSKRAEEAERGLAVSQLSAEERSAFEQMAPTEQNDFLGADGEVRKRMVIAKSEPVEVSKKLEEISKKLADAEARVKAAEEVAKAERDKSKLAEFSKRAEAEYPSLPGSPEEKGALLKALNEKLSEAEFQQVSKALTAGNEAMKQVLSTRGSEASNSGSSAWAAIEGKADGVAKEMKLSKAAAIAEVCKREPELYSRYLAEEK